MTLLEINYPEANFYALIIVLIVLTINYIKRKIELKGFALFKDNSYDEIEAKLYSIDEAVNAIITIDEAGMIISANRTTERLLGYEEKALNHNPATIIMPERYREGHQKGIARIKAAPNASSSIIGHTVELCALRKDGTEFPIELTVKKIELEKKILFVGIIKDITKDKSIKKEFDDKEKDYKEKISLFECCESIAGSGSWRWDLIKKEITISKNLKEIFSFPKEKSVMGEISQKIYHADQHIIDEALDRSFKGEPYEIQYRIVRPDYSVATVQSKGRPLKDENGTITDIYGQIKLIKIENYEDTK